MESQFTEKQINLQGYSTLYLEAGAATDSLPILFLHGWSVSTEPYQESLTALSQRYRVIAPDLPGFGRSTTPQFVQTYNDYVNYIVAFANELKLKNFHLMGHSMGGAIAIVLAASFPSMISSLTLVDSTGIPLGSVLEVLLRRSIEMSAQMWEVKPKPLSQIIQAVFQNWCFRSQNVIQSAQLSLEEDLRPLLSKIESPTLVLWGANDLLTPLNFAQEIAQGIKGSQTEIVKDRYHEWSIFQPEKFAPIIFKFLDAIEEKQY